MADYARAVYPCTVYESDQEYVATPEACPSSTGTGFNSAQEAINDLRLRIETDIREIIEAGRRWWERLGDCKYVPLPGEMEAMSLNSYGGFRRALEAAGLEVHRVRNTTLTVFPEGI